MYNIAETSTFWLPLLAYRFLKLMNISKKNTSLKIHSKKWQLHFQGNCIVGKRATLPSQWRGTLWPHSEPSKWHTCPIQTFSLLPSVQGFTHLNTQNLRIHDNITISILKYGFNNFINMWFNCNLCFLKKTIHGNKGNRMLIDVN